MADDQVPNKQMKDKQMKDKQVILYVEIPSGDEDLYKWYDGHKPAFPDDAGLDLFTGKECIVPAGKISFNITLGACFNMTYKGRSICFMLGGRSSLSKSPLRLSCQTGFIDAGYRGILTFYVDNLSDQDYLVPKGTRLVQIVPLNIPKPISKVVIVDKLTDGSRGSSGFGSSGFGPTKTND